MRAGQIAVDYRTEFADDVVIDLIGFRRHGHSEVDDPTITQPLLYAKIKDHPPLWQIYAPEIGFDSSAAVAQVREEFEQGLASAAEHNETSGAAPAARLLGALRARLL